MSTGRPIPPNPLVGYSQRTRQPAPRIRIV
ncbi:hypothetical protein SRABI128_01798 [Microbacterium sp. Bi128]|nr:hypothetical protein SRABI128_01798 [Microbacterium sp. Bi128]